MTSTSSIRHSWMAAVPTPDAPACTNAIPPSARPPWSTRASQAVMNTSGSPPASSSDTPSGTRTAWFSWTTARSAYPPPAVMAITASPTAHRVTPSPRATTWPANSRPGISCSIGGPGYKPMRCSRSARLQDVPTTSTSTSPGAGMGSGTSRMVRTSGPPCSLRTTARISDSSLGQRRQHPCPPGAHPAGPAPVRPRCCAAPRRCHP